MHFNLQIDNATMEIGKKLPDCEHPGCRAELSYFVRLELNAVKSSYSACVGHVFILASRLLEESGASVCLESLD